MQLQRAFNALLTTITQLRGRVMSIGVLADGTTHMILGEFRAAGAISRQRAQRFHPSSDYEARMFAQLLELEIIRESERGRYFLDENVLAIQSVHRRPQ